MKDHPSKFIDIADKEVCRDVAHLESFFQDVIDRGGEGIILRDPQSLLQPGRTTSYLKHKVLPLWLFKSSFLLILKGKIEISWWWSKNCWKDFIPPMGMRIVSLPFSYGTLHSHSILTSQCSDRMGCDSMHLQDHQNLQRDGILKQEISSPSNIMDIYLPPRNPNSPPSIDCDLICNGMMLFIIGRNRNPPSKVI